LEFAIELLLDNGYPLELIFEKINDKIKTLINNKRNPELLSLITTIPLIKNL